MSVPVEIVEEGQQVESQFAPAFFLTEGQDVSVHDGGRVVEPRTAHHRSAHIPAARGHKDRVIVSQLQGIMGVVVFSFSQLGFLQCPWFRRF